MASWNIRLADSGDAPAIADIHVSAWQRAYRGHVPQSSLDQLSVEQHRKEWFEHLDGRRPDREWVWMATSGGNALGFAFVEPSQDCDLRVDGVDKAVAELVAIYVRPNAWGQGVGRALIEKSSQAAADAGFNALSLWVLETNRRARRLYHHLGFRPDGAQERRPMAGAALPTVRYRLNLSHFTT